MKRQWFFYLLGVVLIIFVTSICVAAPGKNKGSTNTNKQSLESSTRGKERSELRHQVKEEEGLGKEDDDSAEIDTDGEEKAGKAKREKKETSAKSKEDNDSSDDSAEDDADEEEKAEKAKRGKKETSGKSEEGNDSSNDSDDNNDDANDKEQKSKKGKWWEFFKKSEE